tara:strand:+ start:257 stop:688 length:432 start_codon:yes stop_codon:yes gene_type:complete
MEDRNKARRMAIGTKAVGMLKNLPSILKRSADSRACIDNKKAQGLSGRQARRECRDLYGSRLGNAGRKLGILPQQAKGLSVSQFAQQKVRGNTPSKFGMTNEQFILPGGGSSTGSGVAKAGFNPLLIGIGLLFIPGVRKFLGF